MANRNCSTVVQTIGAIALPNVGGFIGSMLFPPRKDSWYEELKKPEWIPPDWVFAPAWTLMYSAIGYASYLVWRDGGGFNGDAKLPLLLYGSGLILNWAWTPLFFGARSIKAGLTDLAIMVPSSAACAFAFYKVNPHAGMLMAPYTLWLGYATAMNLCIYQLNKNEKKSVEEKK